MLADIKKELKKNLINPKPQSLACPRLEVVLSWVPILLSPQGVVRILDSFSWVYVQGFG